MKRSMLIAIVIVVVLAAWMLSGEPVTTAATEPPAASAKTVEKPVFKVEVTTLEASQIVREVKVQGQVEPLRTVNIKAETSGRVTELAAKRGERVDANAMLIKLALDDREARLQQAQMQVRQYDHDLKAAQTLKQKGLQAESKIMELKAALASAQAALESIRQDIAHTRIQAPFAGVLDQRPVELGHFVERGDVIATLVDDSRLLVTAQVPQQSISQLQIGQPAKAYLLDGTELQGTLSYVATQGDDATRSFRVEVTVDNPGQKRLVGLSATLSLPVEQVQAHFVSPSLISLGKEGELVIKTVDQEQHVEQFPVQIVRTNAQGAWVKGLPDSAQVITLGQGFVEAGDQVQAIPAKRG